MDREAAGDAIEVTREWLAQLVKEGRVFLVPGPADLSRDLENVTWAEYADTDPAIGTIGAEITMEEINEVLRNHD